MFWSKSRPTTFSGPYRCGCTEQLGDGSRSLKLNSNRPLVLVQDALPGFSRDEIYRWINEGYQRWAEHCDWRAGGRIGALSEARPGDIVHLITVADLGGGGVLADQVLPYSGARVLRMRINGRLRWQPTDGPMNGGAIDPIRTLCHETGHFMGHQHWPEGAPLELMEPRISSTIIRPQATEGRVSAGWFGPPVAVQPPPLPTPTPVPSPTRTRILLEVEGRAARIVSVE